MHVSHSVQEHQVSVNHKSSLKHYSDIKIKQIRNKAAIEKQLQFCITAKTQYEKIKSEVATMESLPKGINDRLMS